MSKSINDTKLKKLALSSKIKTFFDEEIRIKKLRKHHARMKEQIPLPVPPKNPHENQKSGFKVKKRMLDSQTAKRDDLIEDMIRVCCEENIGFDRFKVMIKLQQDEPVTKKRKRSDLTAVPRSKNLVSFSTAKSTAKIPAYMPPSYASTSTSSQNDLYDDMKSSDRRDKRWKMLEKNKITIANQSRLQKEKQDGEHDFLKTQQAAFFKFQNTLETKSLKRRLEEKAEDREERKKWEERQEKRQDKLERRRYVREDKLREQNKIDGIEREKRNQDFMKQIMTHSMELNKKTFEECIKPVVKASVDDAIKQYKDETAQDELRKDELRHLNEAVSYEAKSERTLDDSGVSADREHQGVDLDEMLEGYGSDDKYAKIEMPVVERSDIIRTSEHGSTPSSCSAYPQGADDTKFVPSHIIEAAESEFSC